MRGIILTTAVWLCATGAGLAQPVIDFEGEVGVGLGYISEAGEEAVTDFIYDIELDFIFSGTAADIGLSYGLTFSLEDFEDFEEKKPFEVFISGAFGRLSLGGDVDGAIDEIVRKADDAEGGNAVGDDFEEHLGYSDNEFLDEENEDGTLTLLYENRFGPVGVAASVASVKEDDPNLQIGANYTLNIGPGKAEIAGAFGKFGDSDYRAASLMYEVRDFATVLGYTKGVIDGEDLETRYIGLGYGMDRWSFHANFGETIEDGSKSDGFGLGVDFALTEELRLVSGYGKDDENEYASLGVYFEF